MLAVSKMKNYIILLTIWLFYLCQPKTQNLIYSVHEESGNGTCYFSAKHEKESYYTKNQHNRIIEVFDPEFRTETITYNTVKLAPLRIDSMQYQIPIRESYTTIILKNKQSTNFLNSYEVGFMFCLVEFPVKYETFSFQELESLRFEIPIEKIEIQSKLVEKIVKNKPKYLSVNQVYLENGNYNIITQAIAGGESHGAYLMIKVKNALSKQGYDLKTDDWQLKKTVKALKEFQQKNNLKIGLLDQETIKALGIEK